MTRGISVEFNSSEDSRQFILSLAETLHADDRLYVPLLDMATDGAELPPLCSVHSLAQAVGQGNQLLFMELFVYPKDSAACGAVADYKQFLRSACKLAVLCSDSTYFDIYTKSEEATAAIYGLCKAQSPTRIELITKETDGRTAFSVL